MSGEDNNLHLKSRIFYLIRQASHCNYNFASSLWTPGAAPWTLSSICAAEQPLSQGKSSWRGLLSLSPWGSFSPGHHKIPGISILSYYFFYSPAPFNFEIYKMPLEKIIYVVEGPGISNFIIIAPYNCSNLCWFLCFFSNSWPGSGSFSYIETLFKIQKCPYNQLQIMNNFPSME